MGNVNKKSGWAHAVVIGLLAILPGCAWFQKSETSPLVGNWTNAVGTVWTIKDDGTFDVDLNMGARRDAWGKYEVDGNTVTLVATGGMKPKGCDGKGIYSFSGTGDNLSFRLISDTCRLRRKNVLLPWR